LGEYKFDYDPEYSYLTLKERDMSEPNTVYYGFWDPEKRQREYKGVILYSNGSVYEGEIHDNLPNGKGRLVKSDYSIQEGEFVNGKYQQEKKEFKDQKLKLNMQNNAHMKERASTMEPVETHAESHNPVKGRELLDTGTLLAADKGNGYVVWEEDGNEYKGNMLNGLPDGYGKFKWSNGNEYEGSWKEGKPHGHGRMQYANGSVYDGEYLNGLRHGQGKFTTSDGDCYDGLWLRDKKNGSVTISGPGKSTILSTWKDDAILTAQEKVY
jgi:hypothetical protein